MNRELWLQHQSLASIKALAAATQCTRNKVLYLSLPAVVMVQEIAWVGTGSSSYSPPCPFAAMRPRLNDNMQLRENHSSGKDTSDITAQSCCWKSIVYDVTWRYRHVRVVCNARMASWKMYRQSLLAITNSLQLPEGRGAAWVVIVINVNSSH